MEPILTSYAIGIATNAAIEAIARMKLQSDEWKKEEANEVRRRRELFKDYQDLVRPGFDEVFGTLEVSLELNGFLLEDHVIRELESLILSQSEDQAWSKEAILRELPLPEGFGLLPELEEFIDRLLHAVQRALAVDQHLWNEATSRALAKSQASLDRLESRQDEDHRLLIELNAKFDSLKEQLGISPRILPKIPAEILGKKYERDYLRLIECLDNGKPEDAEKRVNDLLEDLEIDSEFLSPHFRSALLTCRGHARLSLNRKNEADEDYRTAYELHFDIVSGVNFAASMMRQGRWDTVEEVSQHLLDAFPGDLRGKMIAAEVALQKNGMAAVDSILAEITPKSSDDFVIISEIRYHQRKHDLAIEAAESALAIRPDDPFAKFYKAHALAFELINEPQWGFHEAEIERISEAVNLLDEACKTFEELNQFFLLETIFINISCFLIRLEKRQEALSFIEQGLSRFPDSTGLMERQWRLLTILGSSRKASEIARRLHELDPSPDSALREATTWAINSQFVLAEEALGNALKNYPELEKDQELLVLRAHLLTWSTPPNLPGALEVLNFALQQHPENVTLLVVRAETNQKLELASDAIIDLNKALTLDQNDLVVRGAAKIFSDLHQWERSHDLLKSRRIDFAEDPHLLLAVEMAVFAGDFTEGERLLSLPTPEHKDWPKLQASRADMLVRQGKFQEAEELLDELLASGEIAELARMNFAGKLLDEGDPERGLAILRPGLDSFRFIDTPILGAQLEISLGRPAEAVAVALKAVKQNLENREALKIYAYCYSEKIRSKAILFPEEDIMFETVMAKLRAA